MCICPKHVKKLPILRVTQSTRVATAVIATKAALNGMYRSFVPCCILVFVSAVMGPIAPVFERVEMRDVAILAFLKWGVSIISDGVYAFRMRAAFYFIATYQRSRMR